MDFRLAKEDELAEILMLYRSSIGQVGCTWDKYYPTAIQVYDDYVSHNLYVLSSNEKIIGAISVVDPKEYDPVDFWKINDRRHKEIARVVVAQDYQGQKLAEQMVANIIDILKSNGTSSIHLLVGVDNAPARKTYEKLGFIYLETTFVYDFNYCAYEKVL